MALVDQWQVIEGNLPEGWGDARLRLVVSDEGQCDRAAALLGPAAPGRRGNVISFYTTRRGAGHSPGRIRELLARLDRERIAGRLELTGSAEAPVEAELAKSTFVASWDAEIAALPEDWSDVYAEIELASSDYLERAALLLAPVNPARFGGKPGFRWRAARRFGYGASAEMARRCLERLDDEGIHGRAHVLWALSNTRPVQTQGPVWYTGGKSV
jgi:hypothetical protein